MSRNLRSKKLKAFELLDKVQGFSHDRPFPPRSGTLSLIFGHHMFYILCVSATELPILAWKCQGILYLHRLTMVFFLCLKSFCFLICLVILHSSLKILLSRIPLMISSALRTKWITACSFCPSFLLLTLPVRILFIYECTLHLSTKNSLRTGPVYYSSASPETARHSNPCLLKKSRG